LVEALRLRRVPLTSLAWAAGVLAVTAPTHLFRYLYYGELLPNTFYVKTGGSVLVWQAGLDALRDMVTFNATGAWVLLVRFASLGRGRLAEMPVCLAIGAGFMDHIARVGVCGLRWHRLCLAPLPFLALLGGIGLADLVSTIARIAGSVRVGRVLA